MSGIFTGYIGYSKETLSPEELLKLFDILWGEDARELPGFPQVIGGIIASWHSADGILHNVSHINELIEAYKKQITYDVRILGSINNKPRITFVYIPAHRKATLAITAKTEEIANEYLSQVKNMFPEQEKPIVFISYAKDELALADFIKKVLARISGDKINIFVATRDIRPGADPLKVMMEEKLKSAEAIIPICSRLAKESSWVWWESASVWARSYKVYPLCTNISLGEFGSPLNLVTQGRNYFDQKELTETIHEICGQFKLSVVDKGLVGEELVEYKKLSDEYSKEKPSVKVDVGFKAIEQRGNLHRYSLSFAVENKTNKGFDDIVVILNIPERYVENKKWGSGCFKSSRIPDRKEYLAITFMFSGLDESAKQRLKPQLLPKNKFQVFGDDGIAPLHYYMNDSLWEERSKYSVEWKVYVNNGAPHEGSIPLNSLQNY